VFKGVFHWQITEGKRAEKSGEPTNQNTKRIQADIEKRGKTCASQPRLVLLVIEGKRGYRMF